MTNQILRIASAVAVSLLLAYVGYQSQSEPTSGEVPSAEAQKEQGPVAPTVPTKEEKEDREDRKAKTAKTGGDGSKRDDAVTGNDAKPARALDGPYPRTAQSMLALSWQPAFCQTHRNKPECRDERAGSLQGRQLSLHGLWPDGCAYEGVSAKNKDLDKARRWRELPELQLTMRTRDRLEKLMPGTRSGLDRHEWIKHGSCDGRDAEGYYATSIALTQQVNDSAVGHLLVSRIGGRVSLRDLREAMDRSFGRGAGEALIIKCDKDLISELRLRLGRPLTPQTALRDVLQKNTARSCRGGRIDPAG